MEVVPDVRVLEGGVGADGVVAAGWLPPRTKPTHKERNVLEHLPERDRAAVKRRLRQAWKLDDHAAARERLTSLAGELDRSHPGAA
ncbi:MAG: hypothetical protein M3P39_00560, partial [Actinomycetota bacterium]|nr:hypothetical protein [Actinomycetota bacterium]